VASVIEHGLWASSDAGAHWQRLGEAGHRPADADKDDPRDHSCFAHPVSTFRIARIALRRAVPRRHGDVPALRR